MKNTREITSFILLTDLLVGQTLQTSLTFDSTNTVLNYQIRIHIYKKTKRRNKFQKLPSLLHKLNNHST